MERVLFWDIDGTLLTTARAGIFAWEAAAESVLGRAFDFSALRTAGLTDVEIARKILEQSTLPRRREIVIELLRRYEAGLPSALPRRQGRVLPGVLETLDDLSTRGGVRSILLTGNTRAGARAKLSYYGLEAYFPYGAFSDDKPDRLSIARDALVLARALSPGLRADNCFVIGDTPHDIACGKAIGARTIAIASGEFTLEQLQACGPWLALEALSPVLIAQAVGLD